MVAVQTLGLGLGGIPCQPSAVRPGPAAAPDGHVWGVMCKTGQAELLLFKDEVSSVDTTPSFACMGGRKQ